MEPRNIIVIGASAGGFAVLQRLVADLPPDLPAALFVVWHMSASGEGLLADVLNRAHTLPAADAVDGEPITLGRIYVAPPDYHLLVEPGRVRVTKGPREHRFRPAVDPLFRSAALAYGPRVVGVVLSGALDDGTAGLRAIKRHAGLAVVQDLVDAEVPSMPHSAMRAVAVDYVVPAAELAALLVRVSQEPAPASPEVAMEDDTHTRIEVRIAAQENALEAGVLQLGSPTIYTCPDCHGVLLALRDGEQVRFRCHTGHAFSADSLLAALTATTEDQLWNAVRSLDENILLLNHLGDHLAEAQQTSLAALYYQYAQAASAQSRLVRQALVQHQQLSRERLQEQFDALQDDEGSQS
ncbi:MAG TPA: chemotaxis protein CheB [Roseiflexaceae bacterium]|nr:chemotaxis protein CheB [Roseiflexaceae bacterium]